ncbi:MAG TPA: hypothetical protein VJV79_14590 [Polyangiaceae bacterium]|nr:hypothetical protein [Polyangiaceae bacterium]
MLEPLRTPSPLALPALLGSLVTLVLACSAAPPPEPRAPAADLDTKLNAATQAHTELPAQLAAAPHDILVHCQTTAGDCLISVAERREVLVGKHYLNACRDSDPEKQSPCIARELEKRGERADLASFYETENWCSRKLLECISAFVDNAEQMALRQRAVDRRAQVEAAPESTLADLGPEFAKEKLDFVRAILPPAGQAACAPSTPEDCEKKLTAPNAEYDAELEKAPAAYDAKHALALYAAVQRARAECGARELSCLQSQGPRYGASSESDKLLKQNLALIAQQQQIRTKADSDGAEQCLSAGVTQHSERIVSAYSTYAASPINYSLLRLQKAFIAMHQAQLWCLMALGKPSKR